MEWSEVLVARHCKTEWNLTGRLQGSVDLPLSAVGIAEAKGVCSELDGMGITCVVTSPLKRAVETGSVYAGYLALPLLQVPGLRELDHGLWEGRNLAELADRDPSFSRWMWDPSGTPIPEGSETVLEAQRRASEAILRLALTDPPQRYLVVSHKHLIALLRCALQGSGLGAFRREIVEDVRPWPVRPEEIRRIASAFGAPGDAEVP